VSHLTGIPGSGLRLCDLIRQGIERPASEKRRTHRACAARKELPPVDQRSLEHE
jgi:hypothetical protein